MLRVRPAEKILESQLCQLGLLPGEREPNPSEPLSDAPRRATSPARAPDAFAPGARDPEAAVGVGAGGRDRLGCGEAAERRFRGMAGTALKRLMAEYKRESGGGRLPVLFLIAALGVARHGAVRCGAGVLGRAAGFRVRIKGRAVAVTCAPRQPKRGRLWAQKPARPAPPWPCDPGLVPEPLCAAHLRSQQLMLRGEYRVIPVRWSCRRGELGEKVKSKQDNDSNPWPRCWCELLGQSKVSRTRAPDGFLRSGSVFFSCFIFSALCLD